MQARLTSKLALAIAAAILPVIAISAALRVRQEVAQFEANAKDDNVLLGQAVAAASQSVWRTSGEREAKAVVAAADERERHVAIRWVRLDADRGAPDVPTLRSPQLALVREQHPLTLRGRRSNDTTDSLFTYVAAPTPEYPRAALELREDLSYEAAFVTSTIRHAALATASIVALCALAALGLGNVLVGRPMRALVSQARRIGGGDLTARLHLRRRDEFGVLAGELDDMCEHLATVNEQLRHAERLTMAGELAAGIAHEIGTPLNVISGHAQLIIDEYSAESAASENATIVVEQSQRVAGIIRHLLDFARRRSPQRVVQDVLEPVRRSVELLRPLADKQGVALTFAPDSERIAACIDTCQIEQAITNLAVNAIQSMSRGGQLKVSVTRCSMTQARIDVIDTGTGISGDVLPRIFEPFFTTKPIGAGSGLGLSVTHGIVQEHGGRIDVESTPGKGSRFSLYLPIAQT